MQIQIWILSILLFLAPKKGAESAYPELESSVGLFSSLFPLLRPPLTSFASPPATSSKKGFKKLKDMELLDWLTAASVLVTQTVSRRPPPAPAPGPPTSPSPPPLHHAARLERSSRPPALDSNDPSHWSIIYFLAIILALFATLLLLEKYTFCCSISVFYPAFFFFLTELERS